MHEDWSGSTQKARAVTMVTGHRLAQPPAQVCYVQDWRGGRHGDWRCPVECGGFLSPSSSLSPPQGALLFRTLSLYSRDKTVASTLITLVSAGAQFTEFINHLNVPFAVENSLHVNALT